MPKPEFLLNYRINPFELFGKLIGIAGMAGLHNNKHLIEKPATAALVSMRILKKKNRLVYINLHEKEDFQEEAKEVGIDYHWLGIKDFAKQAISVTILEKIADIVFEATVNGKQVAISCGHGSGRTGVALASLKILELLEQELKQNLTFVEEAKKADTVELDDDEVYSCTSIVKRAVECIRKERIIDPDEESSNGEMSVETENDILSLVQYEQHLRKKLINQIGLDTKPFASHIFGPNVFAGPNPMKYGYKAAVSRNLATLQEAGITKIYSLEKVGTDLVSSEWSKFGSQYQHITEESKKISYLIEDFDSPSIEQMDSITDSILTSIANDEKIYLHCMGGKGRTGTILAALYMRKAGVSAEEAIDFVRTHYNKFAIENKLQEEALEEYEQHLQVHYKSFAPNVFGAYCLVDAYPINIEKDYSELVKKGIKVFSLKRENTGSLTQLDAITNQFLELIKQKKPFFLHTKQKDVGETGTLLAAVYMKETDALAEEAIAFVRQQYNLNSVETKEQVEALMYYGRFLNKMTLEQEIKLRTTWLREKIKTLPSPLKDKVGTVLEGLGHGNVPQTIACEVLLQTCLFIRTEKTIGNWAKYLQTAALAYKHEHCKTLGLAMYALEASLRSESPKKIQYQPFVPQIFGPCCLTLPTASGADNNVTEEAWSELKKEGISIISLAEEKWLDDGSFSSQDLKELDCLTSRVVNIVDQKDRLYLQGKDVSKTGTLLAAVYMKKTGALAEDAIEFVRRHYSPSAVETKEQVEALMYYGQFLNNMTPEQEIYLRATWLREKIKNLPSPLKDKVGTVLEGLGHGNIPQTIVCEVLLQTCLFIRTEKTIGNWAKYLQTAALAYKHEHCKTLGLAMYALEASLRSESPKKIQYQSFAPQIFGPCCLTVPTASKVDNNVTEEAWSELKKEGISIISLAEEKWFEDGSFSPQNLKELDCLTNRIVNIVDQKDRLCLQGKDVSKTGTLLAAVYMKKTGAMAEEAIEFVRQQYNLNAVETKEQVEALMYYGQFLNNMTPEQEIHLRTTWLREKIKNLPSPLKEKVSTVLEGLGHGNIPQTIACEVLLQTCLLIRPEKTATNWVSKYKQLAQKVQAHPNASCKYLGLAMYSLAITAAGLLGTLVGLGTLGLGVPVIAGFGVAALSFFPSHQLYKIGKRYHTLSKSMDIVPEALEKVDVYKRST